MTEEIVAVVWEKPPRMYSSAVIVYHASAAPNYPEAFKEIYRGPPISRKKMIAFACMYGVGKIVDVRGTNEGLYDTHYDWNRRIK